MSKSEYEGKCSCTSPAYFSHFLQPALPSVLLWTFKLVSAQRNLVLLFSDNVRDVHDGRPSFSVSRCFALLRSYLKLLKTGHGNE